ncbi:MAG: TniQ family protein [Allosphingosinicella sp.]|uniref:TniQ family protein n=1 Tax=Allosphingosinicella sp. TaxID=2823234 RepID=UPI003942FA88
MRPNRLFYGFDAEEVCDPQPPIEKESLLSWIARTTLENELPNVTTIMRDIGQTHRNRVVDIMRKAIDVEGLAVILGGDRLTVQAMRAHDIGNGATRYLGSTIRTGDVHTRARRFAPAALAKDETPFYRASWLIRTFPVCTESWQTLRTTCDCGAEQTWATVSSMVLCEECGEDLRDLRGDPVPTEARPGLDFLADILFGDEAARAAAMARLPADLQVLDPGDVYELALLMARIVDPAMANPREKVWRREPMRLAGALAKAGELLPSWPETPWLALAAAGDTKTMLPRCRALTSLHRVLSRGCASTIAAPIAETLDQMRQTITIESPDLSAQLVDLNEAEKILRVNKWKIRAARGAGCLECHFLIRRGEILPAYDRSELEAMAATVDWPSAAVVGKRIGLPPYGVEQLCAMDELRWAKAPHRTLRTGLRVDPLSVAAFEGALRKSASPADGVPDPVPLTAVMRGIGAREKPWGRVLRGLLSGEWPYALSREGCAVREIIVGRADADAIRLLTFEPDNWADFLFSETINQIDACDILNVTIRNRQQIARYKIREHRGGWLFDRAFVTGLAVRIVTSSELSSRHFMNGQAAVPNIRRAGLQPDAFGFSRQHAIPRFDAVLAS